MRLDSLIATAREQGASDLHLEAGLPPALRIRGTLRVLGDPLTPKTLLEAAQEMIGVEQWPRFLAQRSFDFSRTIQGIRCRINVMQTARGVGFAIRLLASFQATLEKLNLHPDLRRFIQPTNGLVLVSGATGSGKSSTLAALIQEINLTEARHILTLESPIEYAFRPRRAYIRQREVGRDTPSFEQALIDALREDPDVLMVGEMRDPETMRLTLNASETGHLVLATVHSGTCAEALQRVVAAFPAEIQASVAAQLADCLVAVIAQRLRFRPVQNIRVPECEILVATHAVRNFIRNRDFFKISASLETGAEHGMWSFQRYQAWLEKRTQWYVPTESAESPDTETLEAASLPPLPRLASAGLETQPALISAKLPATAPVSSPGDKGRIEIEPVEEFDKILRKQD